MEENPNTQTMTPVDLLNKQKDDLFVKLKGANTRLSEKQNEARAIQASLDQKLRETGIDGRGLRKRLRFLEFKISTEATTLQKERMFMKEVTAIEKQLEKVKETEKMDRRLYLVRNDMRQIEEEIKQVKTQIDQIRAEVDAFRDERRKVDQEVRDKEWQEKKRAQLMKKQEEKKKGGETFISDGLDYGVELGSIAIIKKKSAPETPAL